jgi:hypothetical protein
LYSVVDFRHGTVATSRNLTSVILHYMSHTDRKEIPYYNKSHNDTKEILHTEILHMTTGDNSHELLYSHGTCVGHAAMGPSARVLHMHYLRNIQLVYTYVTTACVVEYRPYYTARGDRERQY